MLVSGDVQLQSAIWLNKKTTQTNAISCNMHSVSLTSMLVVKSIYWANIIETMQTHTLDIILIDSVHMKDSKGMSKVHLYIYDMLFVYVLKASTFHYTYN